MVEGRRDRLSKKRYLWEMEEKWKKKKGRVKRQGRFTDCFNLNLLPTSINQLVKSTWRFIAKRFLIFPVTDQSAIL